MKDERLDHSFIALGDRLFTSLDSKAEIKCKIKKNS